MGQSGDKFAIQSLRGNISGLRGQISGLRGQISGLRGPGGTDRRTDGWTDAQTKVPLCFGAAALLLLIPIHNHAKQGNGYR